MKLTLLSLSGFFATLLFGTPAAAQVQERFTPEVEDRAQSVLAQMTEDEKLIYIGGEGLLTKPIERLGIRSVEMTDGPQGVRTFKKSTAYPCGILLAATWNPEMAYRYGTSLAQDCRARGIDVLLGPAVNIYRAPMCGRNFEYMGEDPWLTSRTTVGYIRGLQDHGVMAMVKHFACNNEEYDRNNVSSDVGERTLHEIYFPAFRAAVQEAGTGSVMASYNLLNNVWTGENAWLLQDVLRGQWGFKGMAVSDWEATHNALPMMRGGVDLEMPWCMKTSPEVVRGLLRAGEITWAEIDAKVLNILRTFIAFGFFDSEHKADTTILLDNPASRATALAVAREGVVLLKNEESVLPIDRRKVRKIVVVGNNAQGFVCGGGSGQGHTFSYTDLWTGVSELATKHKIKTEYLSMQDYTPQILFTAAGSDERGLRADFFDNTTLEGAPVASRVDRKFRFDWNENTGVEGLSREQFSARWRGVLRPVTSGQYEFLLGADDGYRLYIDGKRVIDKWGKQSFNVTTYTCELEAGREYDLRIEYYQNGASSSLDFAFFDGTPGAAAANAAFVAKLDAADLVIVNSGFNISYEAESYDRTFELPQIERVLLDHVLRTSTPVVGVVNAGGGVYMKPYEPKMKGLLWAWYPGQEGGRALAEILFGEVSPSGKLPITMEREWVDNPVCNSYYADSVTRRLNYSEGVFVGYRGYDKLKREVFFPFGYGLTYSTFAISDVVARPVKEGHTLVEVEYTLKNTGKRTAAEVVQIYVGKQGASPVERPEKELKCYRKITLKPGESRRVAEKLDKGAFSYYSVGDKDFVLDRGDYRILVGNSSRHIAAEARVTVE